jgi:Uma2 family endonuclease
MSAQPIRSVSRRTATARRPHAALKGATVVAERGSVSIPPSVVDLSSFREWAYSADFPEKIRVCYLDGEIWVDMSQEQVFSHNQVKNEYSFVLTGLNKAQRRGRFLPDGILLSHVDANLSCSPDGTFVSWETFDSGRLRLVEGKKEGYVELEGTPDMVLEIVSAGSVKKDLETLHDLYWKAGIPEYWLVDVRGDSVVFDILRHTPKGYSAARKQGGWVKSNVFGKSFRLTRGMDERGNPEFTLEVR